MLTVTVRLLHGTIRAGSPSDTVMAGGDLVGEWPPSPARLFSALVAGDGTRERQSVTDGHELAVLEQLGPPRVFADPATAVEWSPLQPRYVVKDGRAKGMAQEYPGRTSTEVRPGTKASPRRSTIAYSWDVDVPPATLDALRRRARRVGYLGCADSPVQIIVGSAGPPEGLAEWRPGSSSGVALPVPYPGFTEALDAAFDTSARRAWVPNRWERYASVDAEGASSVQMPAPEVVWLEFDRRVPARRALVVTSTLRDAVLAHADAASEEGEAGRRAPWQLHGHGVPPEAVGYQLVRYLPLLNVGAPHADGAVHGAAVWLPPGCPADVIELVRHATVGRLAELRAPGLRVEVRPRGSGRGKWATDPRRWTGPARRWSSATPAVAERGRRGGPNVDDVRAWFRNAGHPEPAAVRISPVPTLAGAPRLRSAEVHRSGRDRHPFVWLDVEFDEEVAGPLCVGRSRSFGMGLLAPHVDRRGTR